jgi:hypothetical protein
MSRYGAPADMTGRARVQRDMRLRRRLLEVLHAQRGNDADGWVSGRFLLDVLQGWGGIDQRFESEQHMVSLLQDLKLADLAHARDDRERVTEELTIDVRSWRIAPLGCALMEEAIPPHELVADERIRK